MKDIKLQAKLNDINIRLKAEMAELQDKSNEIELRFKAELVELVILSTPSPKAKYKIDIVRAVISRVKSKITLLDLLGNKVLVGHIAEKANSPIPVCRSYLKNHWDKVA